MFGVSARATTTWRMTYYDLFRCNTAGGVPAASSATLGCSPRPWGCPTSSRPTIDARPSSIAVPAHVRWHDNGNDRNNAQPIVVNHVKGRRQPSPNLIVAATNCKQSSSSRARDLPTTTSDTEVISYIITKAPDIRLDRGGRQRAMGQALEGALYSLVIMSPAHRRPR